MPFHNYRASLDALDEKYLRLKSASQSLKETPEVEVRSEVFVRAAKSVLRLRKRCESVMPSEQIRIPASLTFSGLRAVLNLTTSGMSELFNSQEFQKFIIDYSVISNK